MNDVNDNSAGAGDSPSREIEDLALWLDLTIPTMLGLRAEVMDDFIKVWPKDVVPDETNFLIGARFSQSIDECVNILDGCKATMELFEDDGAHWAEVTLPQGVIETNEADSKEMAAAFAVYAVLYGMRMAKRKVSHE